MHCVIMCALKTSLPEIGSHMSNFIKVFLFSNSLYPEPAMLQFKWAQSYENMCHSVAYLKKYFSENVLVNFVLMGPR